MPGKPFPCGGAAEPAEHGGVPPHDQRRKCPQAHQHQLAAQVVADLDIFLECVGGLVHGVVVVRLKEEVSCLARGHGHQPCDQCGYDRVDEEPSVGQHETERTDQMQRLVDAVVVVIAVIVPALGLKGLEEVFHAWSFAERLKGVTRPCSVGRWPSASSGDPMLTGFDEDLVTMAHRGGITAAS